MWAGTLAFAFAFRYLVSLTRGVSWPTVSIVIPPVTIFVVFAGLVTIWIFFFAFPVNLADLLVYVIRISFEAFTACPIFALAVQLLVCIVR